MRTSVRIFKENVNKSMNDPIIFKFLSFKILFKKMLSITHFIH